MLSVFIDYSKDFTKAFFLGLPNPQICFVFCFKPKDQQGDQKQNPQEGKGDKEDQGDQQGQPTPSGISPQEQQQMLDAIQAQESIRQ